MATLPDLTDPTKVKPGGLVGVPLATSPTGYAASQAQAGLATSVGYDPVATTVDKPQTVQGQIADITTSNSPLMQQAERRANERMVGKGLLNSSLAVGAGQSALYDAALPIAQQDAQTYALSNQKTVDARNAEANFRAGAANQASLNNSGMITDVNKTNAAATNTAAATTADAANQARLQQQDIDARKAMQTQDIDSRLIMSSLDRATQVQIKQLDIGAQQQLAQMENQYRQLLQANQNLSGMYQQAVTAIANISIQPNLAKETKDAAIATQLNTLREALAATSDVSNRTSYAVTSLNLGSYFDSQATGEAGVGKVDYNVPYGQQAPNTPGAIKAPPNIPFAQMDWANQAIYMLQNGANAATISPTAEGTGPNRIAIASLYRRAVNGDIDAQNQFKNSSFGYPSDTIRTLTENLNYEGKILQ